VLAVHNGSSNARTLTPVTSAANPYVWAATPDGVPAGSAMYVALFNGDPNAETVGVSTAALGLSGGGVGSWCPRDLWANAEAPAITAILAATLPP
jgi:hypothetical protein